MLICAVTANNCTLSGHHSFSQSAYSTEHRRRNFLRKVRKKNQISLTFPTPLQLNINRWSTAGLTRHSPATVFLSDWLNQQTIKLTHRKRKITHRPTFPRVTTPKKKKGKMLTRVSWLLTARILFKIRTVNHMLQNNGWPFAAQKFP
jgi:hypothetical protein